MSDKILKKGNVTTFLLDHLTRARLRSRQIERDLQELLQQPTLEGLKNLQYKFTDLQTCLDSAALGSSHLEMEALRDQVQPEVLRTLQECSEKPTLIPYETVEDSKEILHALWQDLLELELDQVDVGDLQVQDALKQASMRRDRDSYVSALIKVAHVCAIDRALEEQVRLAHEVIGEVVPKESFEEVVPKESFEDDFSKSPFSYGQ